MNPVPTEYGSVIGWAKFFKGTMHFYCAILSKGTPDQPLLWWLSGTEEPMSEGELVEDMGPDWLYIGLVEIDPDLLDQAVALDRELNGD